MAEQVKMPSNSLETSPRLTAPEDPEEAVGAPGWEAENGEGVHGVLGFCAASTRHPGHRQGLCQASGCSHARLQGSNALALMPVFPERNIDRLAWEDTVCASGASSRGGRRGREWV